MSSSEQREDGIRLTTMMEFSYDKSEFKEDNNLVLFLQTTCQIIFR
jgi:hypothetical protein